MNTYRRFVLLLYCLLLFSWSLPAAAQTPPIVARWEGDALIIDAIDASIYLAGGGKIETYVGWLHVELPIDPARPDYTPLGRETINLRNHSMAIIASIPLPTPTLTAEWEGGHLNVTAPLGSLYLTGGGRTDQFIERYGKIAVVLPAYGVGDNYTPLDREFLEVRDTNGFVIASAPVPLQPDRWKQILPIIRRP